MTSLNPSTTSQVVPYGRTHDEANSSFSQLCEHSLNVSSVQMFVPRTPGCHGNQGHVLRKKKKMSIGHGCHSHCGVHRRLAHRIATAREGNCEYKAQSECVKSGTCVTCTTSALSECRYLGSLFLETEDIKSLSLGAIWGFSKAAGLP
jgi:nitrate reductase beta subunit